MLAATVQKFATSQYFHDFDKVYAAGDWTITHGTGGTPSENVTAGGALGGWLKNPTAASASDYQSISTPTKIFEFLNLGTAPSSLVAKTVCPVVAEGRFLLTESGANLSGFYFGLTDTLTTGLITSAGVPASSFIGAIIYKKHGSATLRAMSSNATVQNDNSNIGTFVSGKPVVFTISFDPGDGVTGYISYMVNGLGYDANKKDIPRQPITLAGLAPMYLSFGIVAGAAGAAETMLIDYWGVESTRF